MFAAVILGLHRPLIVSRRRDLLAADPIERFVEGASRRWASPLEPTAGCPSVPISAWNGALAAPSGDLPGTSGGIRSAPWGGTMGVRCNNRRAAQRRAVAVAEPAGVRWARWDGGARRNAAARLPVASSSGS